MVFWNHFNDQNSKLMREQITIDSVFLSFKSHEILRGVSLNLFKNQVTGILGKNGSGKSCLLKIITGQIKPQHKHIRFNSQPMSDLFKQNGLINYLPQHEFHPKSLTVHQLVKFYGINRQEFLGEYPFLKKYLDVYFSEISGGERRLIEVLLVLESNAKFSILDEPFSHIMPKYIELIKNRIKQLKKRKGILLTDHQYQNVLNVSDDLFIMTNGTIRKIVGIEDLKEYGYIR